MFIVVDEEVNGYDYDQNCHDQENLGLLSLGNQLDPTGEGVGLFEWDYTVADEGKFVLRLVCVIMQE